MSPPETPLAPPTPMAQTAPSATKAGTSRLVEVDALRGLAAISVVAFHYTTQYVKLFHPSETPGLSVPWGHLGVNLFFIISGFVIFMTLDRTRRPRDFIVSRFSRLFPAYWLAVLLTFAITALLGLPGKQVTVPQALANLSMVHGLFRIPHVDSVYWTLEVELLFYTGMLALLACGRLDRVHQALWALMVLGLAYWAGLTFAQLTLLPWRLFHLLIIGQIGWFALGICIYLHLHRDHRGDQRQALLTGTAALLFLAVTEGWGIGLLAAALTILVWAAASGRARWLGVAPLVWLGAVSYPLYLLHENIGWAVMRQLQLRGPGLDLSIVLSLALALLMAQAVHVGVELPSMRAIRQRLRARPRQDPATPRP